MFVLSAALALTFLASYRPSRTLGHPIFPLGSGEAGAGALITDSADGVLALDVEPAPDAFGHSGAVEMHFALPDDPVDYPLEVRGSTAGLDYVWEQLRDSVPVGGERMLDGDTLVAPEVPGFYQLALVRNGVRRIVDGITLAVMVPFDRKKGPVLDGYRIGTYLAERHGRASHGEEEHPAGFVKVLPDQAELPVTKHLRLGDLLTHDGQEGWPRFVAVSPRMLDKIELVVDRVARSLGRDDGNVQVLFDVHSAFRTPAHNRHVRRAARDSRHQYGDAVDVAIDANGDGRLTAADARRVAAVVDSVETEYPDLVGGVGLYTSRRYSHPYVHIDARGKRVRWRG